MGVNMTEIKIDLFFHHVAFPTQTMYFVLVEAQNLKLAVVSPSCLSIHSPAEI